MCGVTVVDGIAVRLGAQSIQDGETRQQACGSGRAKN
jgi:hypothetical protein